MSLYSFYNKRIFPRVCDYRGAAFVKRNLKKVALRNTEKIPELEREGLKEKEWDNLIILDACRHDLFEEVVEESDYRYSLGSTSSEFVEKNFSEGDWSDTVYVTANPHFHESHFEELTGKTADEVFHEVFHTYETDWDKDQNTVLPEKIIRDGLTALELFPNKKLIIHCMQPHYPFLNSNLGDGGIKMLNEGEGNIWDKAERKEVDKVELWEAYSDNLGYIFSNVEKSLQNLDGKTLVTADHANFFGEGDIYGHPAKFSAEPVLKVPWYEL